MKHEYSGGTVTVTADRESEGKRLDAFLASEFADMTRSYIKKLIDSGAVEFSGGKKAKSSAKLREGDIICVCVPEPEKLDITPEDIPLEIVYEDEHLLVVDKPKGMVVHPAPGNYSGTLVNAVLYHCRGRLSSINGVIRPGIVHRIDKDTSGLLVVAKSDEAHAGLAEQLESHSMRRAYRAVVYNNFKETEGTIDKNIGRDPKNRLKMAVTGENSGKRAVTDYRVIERSGNFCFIECRLRTGRTHQIRVHMAYIGHPLLGDPVYGPKKGAFGIEGQVLHAFELGFVHPVTGEELFFNSPLPEYFKAAMKKAGIIGRF